MDIHERLLEKSKKRAMPPTELDWARRQPVKWRKTCVALAVASNTRGGVVGKSLEEIVSDARTAGVDIRLGTLKRQIRVLQVHGVVFLDEAKPGVTDEGVFYQDGSTRLIFLDKVMPADARVTSGERWQGMSSAEWMRQNGIAPNPWAESSAELIPF